MYVTCEHDIWSKANYPLFEFYVAQRSMARPTRGRVVRWRMMDPNPAKAFAALEVCFKLSYQLLADHRAMSQGIL